MKSGDLVVGNVRSCFEVIIGLVQGGNVGCIYRCVRAIQAATCLLQHDVNIKICMFAIGLCIKICAHIYGYIFSTTIHDKNRTETTFTDS